MAEEKMFPNEIDDHLRLYAKESWEVRFGKECPVCKTRIDEYGLCACDTIGGD